MSTDTAPGESGTRSLGVVLVLAGGVGLLAAFVLLLEKLRLLADPAYVPSCSIDAVLSCGTVMRSGQAEAFGVPNPLLGLVGFSVVVATGTALLAGGRFATWFWLGLQAGVVAGAAFCGWLVFQTLYRIGALCPYCLAVWAAVVPISWYVTVHNVRAGRLPVGRRLRTAVQDYHLLGLLLAYVALGALVVDRFPTVWRSLLTAA